MTLNSLLRITSEYFAFSVLIGVGFCGIAEAQNEITEKRAKLVADAIYSNGLINTNQVVELVGSVPQETMRMLSATVYQQKNYLSHLLAKRGHITGLFHLIDGLNAAEKAQLVERLNHSHQEGLLVQHRVLLFVYSPYWVRQFEGLGFDFSTSVKSKSLRDSVILRWGEESDAYRYFSNLKNKVANEDSDNSPLETTVQLIEKINYRYKLDNKANDASADGAETKSSSSDSRPELPGLSEGPAPVRSKMK